MHSTHLAAVTYSSGPRKRNLSIDANVPKVNGQCLSQAKQNQTKMFVTSTAILAGVVLCASGLAMTHKMDSYSHAYCT